MANTHRLGALKAFVDELVAIGRYKSRSEVIRDGLRLLQEREQLRQIKLEEVRRAFQEGINSGKGNTADRIFDRLEMNHSN
jgi:antitoxin ParD1/3/4